MNNYGHILYMPPDAKLHLDQDSCMWYMHVQIIDRVSVDVTQLTLSIWLMQREPGFSPDNQLVRLMELVKAGEKLPKHNTKDSVIVWRGDDTGDGGGREGLWVWGQRTGERYRHGALPRDRKWFDSEREWRRKRLHEEVLRWRREEKNTEEKEQARGLRRNHTGPTAASRQAADERNDLPGRRPSSLLA